MGQEASKLGGVDEQDPATAAVEPSFPPPVSADYSSDTISSGASARSLVRTASNSSNGPPPITVASVQGSSSTSPNAIKRSSASQLGLGASSKPKLPPSVRANGSYPGQRNGDAELSPGKSARKTSYPGPATSNGHSMADRLSAPIHHRSRPHTAAVLGKRHPTEGLADTMASLLLHPSQQGRSPEQKLEENKKELVGKLNNFITTTRTGVK